eukprot:1526745-Prymnesium_polylepis.1
MWWLQQIRAAPGRCTWRVREGRLGRQHLDDGAANRPDVGGLAVPHLLDHLRRHPVGRAAQRIRELVDRATISIPGRHQFGRSKVRQLAHARRVHEHIRTLDVAMQDVPRVQVAQPVEDHRRVAGAERLVERAKLGEERLDRAASAVLKKDGDDALDVVSLDPEVAHNVGMFQPLQQIELALECLRVLLGGVGLGSARAVVDLLDGHELA